ncbi:T9SS type A sorting domain-containing protein [Lewinella sp. W8]|uniref:T9SS type A sorting domain-containing protein n=1 Tax=Lewinella sp. W8 TaxID=2528208 RepID=UPI0010687AAB|nr:T9SS type A sorting domain-containing protein [Lewinella sp. W8]MTB53128.1 T9SS type A sorting domain-containing protein [Lewinella sp. W8]
MKKIFLLLLLNHVLLLALSAQLRFEHDFSQVAVGGEPEWVTPANGKIYFSADDGFQGRELWAYDPETNLSYPVADFNPGPEDGSPRQLITTEAGLFGVANLSTNREGIWLLAATQNEVTNIVGAEGNFIRIAAPTFYQNKLYFLGWPSNGEQFLLYRYDLESAVLQPLTDDFAPWFFGSSYLQLELLADSGELYFTGIDTSDSVRKLYHYSTVADSVVLIKTSFSEAGNSLNILEMTSSVDTLAFRHQSENNKQVLGFYIRGTDSLSFDTEMELLSASLSSPNILFAGEHFYLRQWNRNFSRAVFLSYEFASQSATNVPGIPADRNTFYMEGLADGDLLICTRDDFSGVEFTARKLNPLTGEIQTITKLSELWEAQPSIIYDLQQPASRLALIDEIWFAQGPGPEGEIELFNFNQSTGDAPLQLTNLNPSNRSGLVRLPMQPSPDGGIYLRQQLYDNQEAISPRPWLNYDPINRSALPILTNVNWGFYGKLYQFPGYLVLTQVEYQGQQYEAIAFDSLVQNWVPILARDSFNCNSAFRAAGSVVQFGDYIYLTSCDASGRLQLRRHQMGTPGTEAVSAFTDKSLFKGGLTDETIVNTGTQLILSYGDSNYDWLARGWLTYDGEQFDTVSLPAGRVAREPGLEIVNGITYFNTAAANDPIGSYYPMFLNESSNQLQPILINGDTVRQIFNNEFRQAGNETYFSYQDSLYVHSGVTNEVASIREWPATFQYVYNYLQADDRLYFIAFSSGAGRQLYEWLHGQDTFRQVTNLEADYDLSNVYYAVLQNDVVYFMADDGVRGNELWSYHPNCFGLSVTSEPSNINWPTGSAAVSTDSSAIGPFTYQWSNGAVGPTLEPVAAGFYEVTVTDAAGCSISAGIWVETNGIISSNNEPEPAKTQVLIFPNPTADRLFIRTEGQESVGALAVFTMDGRKVLGKRFGDGSNNGDTFIDTQSLRPGIYVIQLLNPAGELLSVRRFVRAN